MIRIENLVKNYGEFQALCGISFQINDGEIVGFLGANGAGKTTTLKIMTGYLAPTQGNVYVNDMNIQDHSLEIREQIGYLPENNPLYGEMKVFDYMKFVATIRNLTNGKFNQALERVVDQCGLNDVMHRSISTCSKGFRQRIGLAAAIIHDPKILIMDEPVSGLDPNQIVEIRELIRNLGQEKMVIMSSHILQEIALTVDRIVIIDKGGIVADGTSHELLSSFEGKTQLTLEVKHASSEGFAGMETQIETMNIVDSETVDDRHILSIEYSNEDDPREAIFQYAKESNWTILEMSPSKVQLEDVFRTLTTEGGDRG